MAATECRVVEDCLTPAGLLGFIMDGVCYEIAIPLSPYALDDQRHVCLRGREQVCVIGPIMDLTEPEPAR
jgi:hypothetical protein